MTDEKVKQIRTRSIIVVLALGVTFLWGTLIWIRDLFEPKRHFVGVVVLSAYLLAPILTVIVWSSRLKGILDKPGTAATWRARLKKYRSYVHLLIVAPALLLVVGWLLPGLLLHGSLSKERSTKILADAPLWMLSGLLTPVAIAYFCVAHGAVLFGSYLAGTSCYMALSSGLGGLAVEGEILKFFGTYKKQASPVMIMSYAFVFACAYGVLHFAVWKHWPHEYSGIASWQDSIYFSIVTTSTVGYGDIIPLGHLARWLTLGQIIFSVALIAVAVSAALSIWLACHQPGENRPNGGTANNVKGLDAAE